MDKFDRQIAMLRPDHTAPKLDERQFMNKLNAARRTQRLRRRIRILLALAILIVLVGMLSRNILEVIGLTFRYVTDLPAIFSDFYRAYASAISWPGIISLVFSAAAAGLLVRARRDLTAAQSRMTYKYTVVLGVLALGFGLTGLLTGVQQAHAQQAALKRALNERGHLEVRVNDEAYELNAQSRASDAAIRNQAIIERLRKLDISKVYPELKNLNHDGYVAEIRAVNTKDDCIYYVERRLEPALNKVMDANAGCISEQLNDETYHLNSKLQPIKPPKWKVGQTAYFSFAQRKDAPSGRPEQGVANVIILLEGKADDYIARNNSEKAVPKGQSGAGMQSCGIDYQDLCPEAGNIDVFTNSETPIGPGDTGSSVVSSSLRPRAGAEQTRFFGKLTAMDNRSLSVELLNGKLLTIAWQQNYIETFNATGAKNYPQTTTGPLVVQTGDYLVLDILYAPGMNLQQLSISDVRYIGVALKTVLPDPLSGEIYNKGKAMQLEKYRPQ